MVAINPRLTAIALVPLLGLPVAMISLGQSVHRRSQAIQAQFRDPTSHAHENLSGVRVVRAYRQEQAETAAFERLSKDYLRRNLQLARVQGLFFPLLTMLGGLSAVVVLYAGGQLVMRGSVTVGEFVAFGGHPGPRRRLPGPGGRGVRVEHRGPAARHRDPGTRVPADVHSS